ncbi:taste receptor type 2 member 3-like [Leptodactylus fuscus]
MALSIPLFTTDCIVLLFSFLGNMYILIVNGSDWIKNKNLHLTDNLICGVSAFEALFEFLKVCGWVFELAKVHVDVIISVVVNLAMMSCNLWLTTCLCLKFCFTIVTFKHGFFTHLQRRSSRNILFLLVFFLIASFLLILPIAHSAMKILVSNTSLETLYNNVSDPLKSSRESIQSFEAYILVSSLGFLMSSASLLTTIFSLWRHMKRVKINACSYRSPNTDVHMRAVKTLCFTFLSHTLFYTAIFLTLLKLSEDSWIPYISILLSLSNALNAMNTIKGNSRLVKPLDKLLRCLGTLK